MGDESTTAQDPDDYRSLRGSRVVVTGAASGIGRRTAERFADSGAEVVLWDAAASVRGVATALGARGEVVDVTDPDAVEAAGERAGDVDAVVNVAGVYRGAPALELSEDLWRPNLDVNLVGTFTVCRVLGRGMVARRRGAIVNIASQAALAGLPEHAAYAASKGGVLSLTRTLAVEWGSAGVRVNAISPGVVETPMSDTTTGYWSGDTGRAYLARMPLARFGTPDDIASVALFLASTSASFLSGQNLVVDGGWTAA